MEQNKESYNETQWHATLINDKTIDSRQPTDFHYITGPAC